MHIQISERFSYRKLLSFTFPSAMMMIFTSLYGVADGYFVSNFAGKNPFTAVNFIMPFLMVLGAVGFMFGAGGSALIFTAYLYHGRMRCGHCRSRNDFYTTGRGFHGCKG